MIKKKIKPIKEKPKFHCIFCDEIFEAQRKHATYCSNTCRQYFHYFRIQSSASCFIPAPICLYKMLFKPVYLENNYSGELHTKFIQFDAVEIRNWIHLQRLKEHELERKANEKQLTEISKKLDRLEERLINEELSKEIFDKFYTKLKDEKKVILPKQQTEPKNSANLENTIKKAIQLSSKLNTIWASSDYIGRQKLQYLIFPDGVSYNRQNDTLRTFRTNSIFRAMADLARVVEKDKPNFLEEKLGLSDWVEAMGGNSNFLMGDLQLFEHFNQKNSSKLCFGVGGGGFFKFDIFAG